MFNILMATDLSARSDRAMERAIMIARRLDAKVTILHVIDEDLPAHVADVLEKTAREIINEYVASIEGAKAFVKRIIIDFGKDWKEILHHAKTLKADLIVLGMHREEPIRFMLHGTTVERVLRKGIWPMLVARENPLHDYKKILVGD